MLVELLDHIDPPRLIAGTFSLMSVKLFEHVEVKAELDSMNGTGRSRS